MYYPRYLPLKGGIETYISEITTNLPQYNFKILTNSLPNHVNYEKFGQNTEAIRFSPSDYEILPINNPIMNKLILPYRILSDFLRLHRQQSFLQKEDFNLINLHWPYTQLNIALLSKFLKKDIFYRPLHFNIDTPEVLTIHGLISKLNEDNVFECVESKVLNHYENIICVDKYIYKHVIEVQKDADNVWYIPNCVNTDVFNWQSLVKTSFLKVGFIGRLEKSRGIDILIELIKNKPDFIELHIVGGGNKLVINQFLNSIDSKRIYFYENLPNESMPDFLHGIDVLFNPVLAEGTSRVTMESMSCGRPVIMLNKGNRYPVIKGKTGFLVENELKELIDLLYVLHNDFAQLEKMSTKGRKLIELQFSNKVIIPKINTIYSTLME